MKIVHIVEGFGGGVYSFLVDLCNSLARENEVVLIYNRRNQTPLDFEKDFDKRIKLINIKMSRSINPINDISVFLKLYSQIKNEKPDIIHLHSTKAGALGRIVGRLCGYDNSNLFYNPHGYAYLQENISKKKRKLYYYAEKMLAKLGGTIVAVSKGEYEESKRFSKNIVRIDNAIDFEELKSCEETRTINKIKTIGTLGRITYQKNPKMFNEIAKRFPNINFLWIGDGELREELTSPNISITGWKERYDAIRLVNNIDMYIQTSLWEGLPIALLEAMYLGKPVIANNVIGNRDVVIDGENGYVCNDVGEFEKCLNEVINNEIEYKKLSKGARKYVIDNHSMEDMIINYKKLYSLVNEKDNLLQLDI